MDVLFITIIKVDIIIPNINNVLSIGCFYKAYKINGLIKNKDIIEQNKDK